MSAAEHYLRLRRQFTEVKEGSAVEVTRDQLATLLCCTVRHVPLVLKKLAERKWIDWLPGSGRGHVSRLTFRLSADQLYIAEAQELVAHGQITEAIERVTKQVSNTDMQERFFRSLEHHFGLQSELREQKRIDTLRLPFNRPLLRLDPAFVYRRTEAHMIQQVVDTLLRFDSAAQRVAPQLAHYWESDASERAWTIYLRKGVLFHHGREMTAEDVKLTFERIMNPATGSGYRNLFTGLQEMTVLSDTAIRFTFSEPHPLFPNYLCLQCTSIIPMEKVLEPDFARLPIGTGPWRIVRNDESMLAFEAFTRHYFGRPHLDRVEVLIVPETKRGLTLGELEGKEIIFYPFQPKPEEKEQWLHVHRIESGVNYAAFNLWREGPLQDPLLREAIDLGLNRARMIRELNDGRAEAFGFVRNEEVTGESHLRTTDMEQAKRLVSASSYRGENLRIFVYEGISNRKNASWLCDRLAEIGVNAEVVVLTPEEMNVPANQLKADMINAGFVYDDDLELSLAEIFENGTSYIRNFLGPELTVYVDERIAAFKREPDKERRMAILLEIELKLKAERALLFLYHAGQSIVYHPSLQGVHLNVRGWVDYKMLWVKE